MGPCGHSSQCHLAWLHVDGPVRILLADRQLQLDKLTFLPYSTEKILTDNPELYKHWTSLIPVGKMGKPEDLMGAVVYLLSEASGYVTGADIRVDGGYTVT